MVPTMGFTLTGIWLLHFGVIAILDAKMFKVAAIDGKRQVGALVWGIIMLSVAAIASIEGLWGLFGSFRSLGFVGDAPFPILTGLLANMVQIALCAFVILSGVNRIRMRAPGFGVLKIVLGACAMFFGLLLFVAIVSQGFYF